MAAGRHRGAGDTNRTVVCNSYDRLNREGRRELVHEVGVLQKVPGFTKEKGKNRRT